MRVLLVALLFGLAGCVSQPQPNGYSGDDFDRQEAARTRISLGLTYLKNGNYTQAKANLDKALEFGPRLADTHYSLAYYYQLVGEVERAKEAYNNAMKLEPRNADIANSYGAFLCQQGDYEEAQSYFLKAINSQTYANSAETYENMALCAQGQSRSDDAIQYLQDALKHSPGRSKTLFLLAEMYLATEQYDLADETLKRFQKVARVSPDSLWLAIEIARGQGNLSKASGFGDMLVKLFPQHVFAARYLEQKEQLTPQITRKSKTTQAAEPAAASNAPIDSSTTDQQLMPEVSQAQPQTVQQSAEDKVDETPLAEPEVVEPTVVEENQATGSVEKSNPRQHIVQQGENLYRLSLKYNIKLETLKQWNNLPDSGAIQLGMALWLVPPEEQQ